MSQTRTLTLTFAGASSQDLPGGRFLFIKSATAALDITLTDANGSPSNLIGVGAGARLRRLDREAWRFTKVTSATAQVVVLVLSDDAEFDVANTVSVSGSVNTTSVPSSTLTATANTPVGTSASVDIPANPSRLRITIGNDANSSTHFWVRDTSGTTSGGIQLQPGTFIELRTTAAIRIRNNDAVLNPQYFALEET